MATGSTIEDENCIEAHSLTGGYAQPETSFRNELMVSTKPKDSKNNQQREGSDDFGALQHKEEEITEQNPNEAKGPHHNDEWLQHMYLIQAVEKFEESTDAPNCSYILQEKLDKKQKELEETQQDLEESKQEVLKLQERVNKTKQELDKKSYAYRMLKEETQHEVSTLQERLSRAQHELDKISRVSRLVRMGSHWIQRLAVNGLDTELDHLQQVFEYPSSLVSKHLQTNRKKNKTTDDTKTQQILLITPYVRGLSEKIERQCHNLNVKMVFSSQRTLRKELVQVKKKTEPSNIKGVIYKIGCNCGQQYIGETGRTLTVRMKEHISAVKRDDSNNGISVHANATWHDIGSGKKLENEEVQRGNPYFDEQHHYESGQRPPEKALCRRISSYVLYGVLMVSFIILAILLKYPFPDNNLTVFVTGKAGSGKTSLIYGLLGADKEEMERKRKIAAVTLQTGNVTRNGVSVTILERRSLGHVDSGVDSDEVYLVQNVDLVLYTVGMDDEQCRLGDKIGLEEFGRHFGVGLWNKTVIALTFANRVDFPRKEFRKRRAKWSQCIHEVLLKENVPEVIRKEIPIIPVGYYKEPKLFDESWIDALCSSILSWLVNSHAEKNLKLAYLTLISAMK